MNIEIEPVDVTPTGIAPELYQLFVGIAGVPISHSWLWTAMVRAYYAALSTWALDDDAHRGMVNELLALVDHHQAGWLEDWLLNEYEAWLS